MWIYTQLRHAQDGRKHLINLALYDHVDVTKNNVTHAVWWIQAHAHDKPARFLAAAATPEEAASVVTRIFNALAGGIYAIDLDQAESDDADNEAA